MDDKSDELIIEGIRIDGSKFRPSDWIERLSSLMSTFGPDQRLHYSPTVHPCIIQGAQCLVVARGLEKSHPDVYRQIVQFAEENQLRIKIDQRHKDEVVDEERREQR